MVFSGPLSDSSFDPQVSMFVTLIAVLMVGALVGFVEHTLTEIGKEQLLQRKNKQKQVKIKKEKNNFKLLFFPILLF